MTRHLLASLLLLSTFTCLAAQETSPQPVLVGEKVMAKQITSKVAPDYPPLARQARIQGTVVLKVQIGKSGDVERMQPVSGPPMLVPPVIEAVKQWKYRPYLINGEPTDVETNVTVNFTLSGKSPAEDPSRKVPQRVWVWVSQGVAQAFLVTKVQPEYPADAKDQRIQGAVLLNIFIDEEGNVAHILFISGHTLLARAAMDAVKQWKYRPYLLNGTPIEVETPVTVNFSLAE